MTDNGAYLFSACPGQPYFHTRPGVKCKLACLSADLHVIAVVLSVSNWLPVPYSDGILAKALLQLTFVSGFYIAVCSTKSQGKAPNM